MQSRQALRPPGGGSTATWAHGREQQTGKEGGEEGQGGSAGAPRGDQAATGLGAVVAASQVASSWGPAHHHWGTAPLTHGVGGEAEPPGGGAGSPAYSCCNAPPDPTTAGQDASSALTLLPQAPATTPAPRLPQLAHGRSGGHSHDRAGQNSETLRAELRADSPPSPATPHL